LKSVSRSAGAEVISTEFLHQFFVTVDNSESLAGRVIRRDILGGVYWL
jgi:hypothetical protein